MPEITTNPKKKTGMSVTVETGDVETIRIDDNGQYHPDRSAEPHHKTSCKRSWNVEADDPYKNIPDLKKVGRPGFWIVLSKANSEREGWTKITKAHPVQGFGCLVEVTVETPAGVADTTIFVPNVRIVPDDVYPSGHNKGNRLVKMCLVERIWTEAKLTWAWMTGKWPLLTTCCFLAALVMAGMLLHQHRFF